MKTLILSLIILTSMHTIHVEATQSDENPEVIKVDSSHLTPRGPINIASEVDFSIFPGSGTELDPYIIENYNITGSDTAIHISNIQAYFVIRNNYLNGLDVLADGIIINDSENGIISNNTVTQFGNTAISLQGTTSNTEVVDNEIKLSSAGISLGRSQNTIKNNHIHDIQTIGIFDAWQGSHFIEGNRIYDVSEFGILIDRGVDTVVYNNTIYNFGIHGLGIFHDISSSQFPINNTTILSNNITVTSQDKAAMSINAPNTVIKDNLIKGLNLPSSLGLEIGEGAEGLVIEANSITALTSGITFWTDQLVSSNHRITGNIIQNMGFAGILLSPGGAMLSDIKITENLIEQTDEGISDFGAHSVTIQRNLIFNSRNFGVKFELASDGSLINKNDIISNSGILALSHSENVSFEGNYYSDGAESVYDIGGDGNIIDRQPQVDPYFMRVDVVLVNSDEYAVNSQSQIRINPNHYWTKNLTNIAMYYSTDNENWELVEVDLYQNDLVLGTLNLTDGDHVYFQIEVTSEYSSPVSSNMNYYFFNESRPYVLTELELITPSETTLNGTVTISWTKVTENYGLSLSYSVYVLRSGDRNWTLLSEDLMTTSYEWDTTTFENGEYLLRVVVSSELGATKEFVSSTLFTVYNEISDPQSTPTLKINGTSILHTMFSIIGLCTILVSKTKRVAGE